MWNCFSMSCSRPEPGGVQKVVEKIIFLGGNRTKLQNGPCFSETLQESRSRLCQEIIEAGCSLPQTPQALSSGLAQGLEEGLEEGLA